MSRPKTKATPTRLNIKFSPQTMARLDRLVKTTEARSQIEVISRAISLYDFLIANVMTGNELYFRDTEKYLNQIILIPPAT